MNKLLADVTAGTSLGYINNVDTVGTLILNAVIILGRVALEFFILRKEKRKRDNLEP